MAAGDKITPRADADPSDLEPKGDELVARLRELAERIARRAPLMSIPVNAERDGDCLAHQAADTIAALTASLKAAERERDRMQERCAEICDAGSKADIKTNGRPNQPATHWSRETARILADLIRALPRDEPPAKEGL